MVHEKHNQNGNMRIVRMDGEVLDLISAVIFSVQQLSKIIIVWYSGSNAAFVRTGVGYYIAINVNPQSNANEKEKDLLKHPTIWVEGHVLRIGSLWK